VTRATALPPEERRAAIARATVPLLVEHGASLTTKQIAAAAGVAEGTLFRAFQDKDALIAAAIEQACDPQATEAALEGIDPDLPLEQLLTEVVRVLLRNYGQAWRVLSAVPPRLEWRSAAEFPTIARLLTRHRDALRDTPRQVARQVAAVTLSLSHPAIYPGAPAPAREIVALLLNGLRR
jgi:AcrR family transcriptional regulator